MIALTGDVPKFQEKYQSNLQAAYICNASLRVVARKFKDVAESRKLDVYLIASLLYTLVTMVVVFALEFQGLQKVAPGSFHPLESKGILDFLGFSFATLMTSSVSQIAPATGVAQLICHLENMFGLVLILIVASFVLNVSRERHREDLERVITELDNSAVGIEEQLRRDYEFDGDIELHCIQLGFAKIVNTMRRLRGERDLPDAIAPSDGGDAGVVSRSPPEASTVSSSSVELIASAGASEASATETDGGEEAPDGENTRNRVDDELL